MNENSDGKFVVIKNGQRVTAPVSEGEANAEAQKQRKAIQERGGEGKAPTVEVKRNLFG